MRYRFKGFVVALCMAPLAILSGCDVSAIADAGSSSGSSVVSVVNISGGPSGSVCVANGPVTFDLSASDNLGGDVNWSSTNDAVASVVRVESGRGRVTVKSAGDATIIVTSISNPTVGKSLPITATTNCGGSTPPPSSGPIEFVNPGPFSLNTGAGCVLQFTMQVRNGQPVNWESSNTNRATVTGNGTPTGTVSIVRNATGPVNIMARSLDNVYSKEATLYLSNTACVTGDLSFNASPNTIVVGQSSTLSWNSANTEYCDASGGWSGRKAVSGSEQVSPTQTTTYTLTCNGPGGSVSASVVVTVQSQAAPSVSLTANPTSIAQGQSSNLVWSSTNATSCVRSGGWSGSGLSGNVSVNPTTTTTYTIVCEGPGGSTTQNVTVSVTPAPPMLLFFSADPTSVSAGQSSNLSWSSSNTTSCTASGGWSGTKPVTGSQSVSPSQTTVYTITCVGSGGQVQQSVTVTVTSVVSSLIVSPDTLRMYIGNSGTLFATGTTSNGSQMPTPTWVATLGCVQLSSSSGSSVIVTGVRACRDSVVASSGGKQDFAIVIITSGVNSISYSPPGGTLVVNNTQQLNATCSLASGATCNPYWYSDKADRFTVVGAPYVCMISGVAYPCGPNATIKAIAAGQALICAQAAVQDPTVKACHTWTATAAASSSSIAPNKIWVDQREMVLQTAPPPGAKVERIMTWNEYHALR